MLTKLYVRGSMELSDIVVGATLGDKLKNLQSSAISEADGVVVFAIIMCLIIAGFCALFQKRKLAYMVIVGGVIFAVLVKYAKSIAEWFKGAI